MAYTHSTKPIAVVGFSFRLPGGANDLDTLWELLESGEPAWTPVPADRWNEEAFYHPNPDDPNGTSYHPGGHFLSADIRDFDHGFFQFTKQQAAATDPQQRMLLELAYEAFESAGISKESVAGTATSVYTAMFPLDYERQLYKDTMELPVYYASGVEKTMLANRLSHAFDLRGPSMSLDTACSGGLIALHQACQSLRDGESDTALVAATNLILSPDTAIGLGNLHMTSSTGRCYPFDERGEGYGRGEGVVVLVVKRLEDAVRDGDPVRAIVRGSAAGQDGYTPQGITYPNGQAQAELARMAYARAGMRPEEIVYVEAHGTGTRAGDSEEMRGIADVFAGSNSRSTPLYVGSIKGAVGHTESVAGLASLLKATAMLDRGLIPPVAGFANPKPGLPLDRICVPTKLVPWPQDAARRVSISSYGFGGTNAHIILEKGLQTFEQPADEEISPRLFTFSAHSPVSLQAMIRSYHDWLAQRNDTLLADLSYTLSSRRSALRYRCSYVADDRGSLLNALEKGVISSAIKPTSEVLDSIFVFTGQGSQWVGMGRELLVDTSSSIFRDSILVSRDMLHGLGATWDLEKELLRPANKSRLNEAELAQPATSAIQIALLALLHAQGVKPRAVVGHSSGEVAAAYATGHLSHEMAIKVAFHRGFMAQAVKDNGIGRGAMLSVGLGEREVAEYIEGLARGKATVACINSPRSVTISGDAEAIDEVAERISRAGHGTFYRKLLVDTAYHSHHMHAVADEYRARLGTLEGNNLALTNGDDQDHVTFISSVTGEPKVSSFDAEYWVANLVSPVRFADAVQALVKARYQSGQHTVFTEIGPHPSLAGAVRQNLQHPDLPKISFEYQGSLQRKMSAVASVLSLIGKLFERGIRIEWRAVLRLTPGGKTAVVRHDLPPYPWDHSTKHWHESRAARAYRLRKEPYHDLVGVPAPNTMDLEPQWRHFLSLATLPWLADHVVDGLAIFPGAGYLCMAIEATAQLARQRFSGQCLETFVLSDIYFKRGLIVPERQRVEVHLNLRPLSSSALGFHFSITALSDSGEWNEHATGIIDAVVAEEYNSGKPQIKTEELPKLPPGSDTVLKDSLYADMHASGNTYGPAFAGLEAMAMAPDASLATASFAVPDIGDIMPYQYQRPHVIHPCTLDMIFHTALPLVGRRLGPGSIMPVHIHELLISANPSLHRPGSTLGVSTMLTSSHFRTGVADVSVLASGTRVLSISGMELRSLAVHKDATTDLVNGTESKTGRGICYEVEWTHDVEYMRTAELSRNPSPSLADLVTAITLKCHELTSIGLGASVDLTVEFMDCVEASDGMIVSHEFTDATPIRFDDAEGRLKDRVFPVQFRTLRPGTDAVARGFEADKYDVVLTTSAKWLKQASVLVKAEGIIVLVLGARETKDAAGWRTTLDKTPVKLVEQLDFYDDSGARLVVVARPAAVHLPGKIHVLTHSTGKRPVWVLAVAEGLRSRNTDVSIVTLDNSAIETLRGNISTSERDAIIIADDRPDLPILNDAETFPAAFALLGLPVRLVWLSPDDPVPFHQVTGVSRTAHAENGDLRLITIHASSRLLANDPKARTLNLVADAVNRVLDLGKSHTEREYRLREDGAIMIPRLRCSDRLDSAVANDVDPGPRTESALFAHVHRPVILSPDNSGFFVQDENCAHATALGSHDIEVETRASVLAKAGSAVQICEYVGVVTQVGADVKTLAPGDAVVALAPVAGASRLRIPAAYARHLTLTVPLELSAALLLDAMAASYAVRRVAGLSERGGTVLVHGARTSAGRAVIAIARSSGLRVTATAADLAEARMLEEQLGIAEGDVLVTRRSLYRRLPSDVFGDGIDAVIQTGKDSVPVETLACIKPFGSLVALGNSFSLPSAVPMLPNVTTGVVDMGSLLRARPDLIPELIGEATVILGQLPRAGFDVPVFDVAEAREASRLIRTGVHSRVVLKADPESTVQVIAAPKTGWSDEDATYLVAGGLGDLGQRLLFQMARRGAKHLAIISRRAVEQQAYEGLQAKLNAVRPGAQLYCLQCDISSEQSVEVSCNELARRGAPPVRGVIQSAVVMDNRAIEGTTYESFASVTKTKVGGTLALLRVFSSPHLSFFISLSSLGSIVGASGSASYNAGNAVQDALSQLEERKGPTRMLTVNIGWIEDALSTRDSETRRQTVRRAGFTLLRSEELARFFDYVLGAALDPHSSLTQAVIGFDTESLAGATAANGNIHSGLFSQVRNRATKKDVQKDGTDDKAKGPTFEQVMSKGNVEEVAQFIAVSMTAQLERLISVDAGSIDTRQGSILALGLDSLVAVELRNWVMSQFKAPLQSSEILANQTVHALAEKVASRSRVVPVGAS